MITARHMLWSVMLGAAVAAFGVAGAGENNGENNAAMSERDQRLLELKVKKMVDNAEELLQARQVERAEKMLQEVPRLYPTAKERFRAYLVLGSHYIKKREFEKAIRQFKAVTKAEDPDQRAEGLYRAGICYYHMNNFDQAFIHLRRVTNEFPWSVFANEAYYYIGQCHFKRSRWAKAIQALKMVGTSVPTDTTGDVFAEAGQRLYVKIKDKDVKVLIKLGEPLKAVVRSKSGDEENVTFEPLGRGGEFYIGSVETRPGVVKKGDGVLQIRGGDAVRVFYKDRNTESGKRDVPVNSTVRMVSTAAASFTAGNYQEFAEGVFGGDPAFIRVKDMDRDTTDQPDQIEVRVTSQYKHQQEEDVEKQGILLEDEPEWENRHTIEVTLKETGPHTGIFIASISTMVVDEGAVAEAEPNVLLVRGGDRVELSYIDELHLDGEEPRDVTSQVPVVVGRKSDMVVLQDKVSDPGRRAKKNLVEGRIFLELGRIFKDVGLVEKANEKADVGLERVNEIISDYQRHPLQRDLVEEAFSIKWELLLVKDQLQAAIAVCRALIQIFPNTELADKAFLKIAQAKMSGEDPTEAIPILSSIIALPTSDLKAEAQYNIAEAREKAAIKAAEEASLRSKNKQKVRPNLSSAMVEYKKCAESYPDSAFAGESLQKIANYYILYKDYARAVELMERVFQDFPDAEWLDEMALKWGVALYKLGNIEGAKEKFELVLREYPGKAAAKKASKYLQVVNKKLAAVQEG